MAGIAQAEESHPVGAPRPTTGSNFANTYPTQGLKNLLRNVLARLSGDSNAAAAIFRLDTSVVIVSTDPIAVKFRHPHPVFV